MLYAIMSDAHANPVALETALKDARALGCKKFLFLFVFLFTFFVMIWSVW